MSEEKFNTEGLRSFVADNGKTYYISTPTAEDIRGADWQYSKVYTNSLVEGIMTSAEMTDLLMRRGIIGPEFEQRSNELSEALANKIAALENAKTTEEKQTLAIEVANAREELFQWNQRLNAPLANTCEQIADDSRLEYLTSCIIVDEEGNKVWNSFDEYLVEKEQGLAQQARFEVMVYLQGLDSNFLEQTPEAVAMREVEEENMEAVLDEMREEAESESKVQEEKPGSKTISSKKSVSKKTSSTRKPRNRKTTAKK